MAFLVILCTLVLMVSPVHTEGEASDALEKVEAALDVGDAILEILTDEDTTKFFKQIGEFASKIAPFFGAIGPIISIITMFLPQSPSEEMKLMKKEFARIDAKFDQVFNQFGQLENLLTESSIKCQYSQYAQTIRSLSTKLNLFLDKPFENAHFFKESFITEYESSYAGATWKLLDGMVSSTSLSDNIPYAAMRYTDNHRRKTQEIMKGVINLIMQGIKVVLAYTKFKGEEEGYNAVQLYWEGEMNNLLGHVKEMDIVVRDKWYVEFSDNIDAKLATWYELDNEHFANELYWFLNEKFDWRYWHVVAYNQLSGFEAHTVKTGCYGYFSFRKHGRNLVVNSVEKSEDSMIPDYFKMDDIYNQLRFMQIDESKAETIYGNVLPDQYTSGCDYASVGVIEKDADIAQEAPHYHLVRVYTDKFEIYVFD